MITKDHSLKEIDVLKLIMYVLAFIFALVFFIALLIIPSIKEYKKLKIQNQASIVNLNKIEQIYKSHAGALNDFKIKNNKLLNAAIAPFDEKDFIEQAKKYFSEIEIDAGLQESFPFFIWFIYYKIKQRGLAYE